MVDSEDGGGPQPAHAMSRYDATLTICHKILTLGDTVVLMTVLIVNVFDTCRCTI